MPIPRVTAQTSVCARTELTAKLLTSIKKGAGKSVEVAELNCTT